MKGKSLAIPAAAFCAGLFVTLLPSIAPRVEAGRAEDSGLVVPNIVTIDKFAAKGASTTSIGRGPVQARRPIDSWSRKAVRADGWPYCDPACQRGGREVDGAHGVFTANPS